MKHFWINIQNELPPAHVLVWVKRNVRGNESYYLASRNSSELSTDPDASRNCHWSGTSIDLLRDTPESGDPLSLRSQFSDVTVKEWCFLEPPVDINSIEELNSFNDSENNIRDQFAGLSMKQILTEYNVLDMSDHELELACRGAYIVANFMLKARKEVSSE